MFYSFHCEHRTDAQGIAQHIYPCKIRADQGAHQRGSGETQPVRQMKILSRLDKVREYQDAERQRHHRQLPKTPHRAIQQHDYQQIPAIRADHRVVHAGADKDLDPEQQQGQQKIAQMETGYDA